MLQPEDTKVTRLGKPTRNSPLKLSTNFGDGIVNFTPDDARVRHIVQDIPGQTTPNEVYFEMAGPREKLYFDPSRTKAAIVTCGGLCPGLNTVIRSVYLELYHGYGVQEVYGVRYGYRGLHPDSGAPPFLLTHGFVEDIHREGGTVLGSSRGPGDVPTMVTFLKDMGVNLLFCVGGDGTQRGAYAISEEARSQDAEIAVVGIPKTIDNDIPFVERTFGFSTAIEQARHILDCAHTEAQGYDNCVALVKLMGRHAGFIAAASSVASQDVNFCLVPEMSFQLEGDRGLLPLLVDRIEARRHAVIAVAEGAGQDLLDTDPTNRDPSGNVKLADIGPFLRGRITEYFQRHGIPLSLKYFDPSYAIRSTEADANDSVLCDQFARSAVHAAMSGRTGVLIGMNHSVYTHVPIGLVVSESKRMEPEGDLWRSVLATTGQPARFK